MAYIESNPLPHENRTFKKTLGIVMLSCFIFIALLAFRSENPALVTGRLLLLFVPLCAIVLYVYFKIYPLMWHFLFNKKIYNDLMALDNSVLQFLEQLDDTFYICSNFTMEFFHVEYLLLSQKGAFIIKRIDATGEFHTEGGILYAGEYSFEKTTAHMWRVCHMINILMQKAFKYEIMPVPVLLTLSGETPAIKNFDDIVITTAGDLLHDVLSSSVMRYEPDVITAFASFIKHRYIR